MRYVMVFCVTFYFLLIADLSAQDSLKYKLSDVIVSAGRAPVIISKTSRTVTVIKSAELSELPTNSIQDVLQYIGGVDIKQRGVEGVQGDISIRGSTFEQTLLMIDGIKVVDPQTGHHNLNLPVTVNDIERIEVVKGQASKSFGPNAFGGVINIITKKSTGKTFFVEAEGGENNYYGTALSGSYNLSGFSNRVSFSKTRSDGYRRNTEFDLTSFNYSSGYAINAGTVNLLFGFDEKDFGANSFYTAAFPDQAEHTITKMLNLSADLGNNSFYISPKIFWRRNNDEFVLNKFDPSFYKNLHETNVYGAEIQSTLKTEYGSTALGFEYTRDEITSSNLGKHQRDKKGLFFEHAAQVINNVNISFGGFVYKYADLDWQFWPGLDASYNFTNSLKSFFSVGKAFRIPTYTELYYSDPVTVGNSELKQEEAVSYEFGLSYNNDAIFSTVSLFRREGKNIIDWVRTDSDNPWTVRNIAEVNTNGFEVDLRFQPDIIYASLPVTNVTLNYTFLDSDKKTESFDSRYVLDHLKHQVIAGVQHKLVLGITADWFFRYEDRLNFEDSFVTDLKLRRSFNNFTATIGATNLLDRTYHDIAGVVLPGRWIKGSIKYKIDF